MPQATLGTTAHETGDSCHSPVVEDVGTPTLAPGLLQVSERRRKYGLPAWHAPWGPASPPGHGEQGPHPVQTCPQAWWAPSSS